LSVAPEESVIKSHNAPLRGEGVYKR
jgi:hypothetical protein